MISTSEAKAIIQENVKEITLVLMPLEKAAGLTIADDVYATNDVPAFPQSSMDGYAFSFSGWNLHNDLVIDGEMAAGNNKPIEAEPHKAIRIFTGAAVPPGADTVVMQEKTKVRNGKLLIEDDKLHPGGNVRPKGSEIRAGELALPKGINLSPAAMGFLAGIGISEVLAYPRPSVTIIITGNELKPPGTKLEYGQVYESNSCSLLAALHQLHISDVKVQRVHDDLEALSEALQAALQTSDVVLLTGGISVGDYDFVLQAATSCGVSPMFHKVKQKPGKPLFFGMRQGKPVFGLPGNPSAVLTCFYLYVVAALEQMSRHSFNLRTIKAPLSSSYQKVAGLTHYLKGIYNGQTVTILEAQESYRMRSFALANCLVQINEEETDCKAGTMVYVHLLPNL